MSLVVFVCLLQLALEFYYFQFIIYHLFFLSLSLSLFLVSLSSPMLHNLRWMKDWVVNWVYRMRFFNLVSPINHQYRERCIDWSLDCMCVCLFGIDNKDVLILIQTFFDVVVVAVVDDDDGGGLIGFITERLFAWFCSFIRFVCLCLSTNFYIEAGRYI